MRWFTSIFGAFAACWLLTDNALAQGSALSTPDLNTVTAPASSFAVAEITQSKKVAKAVLRFGADDERFFTLSLAGPFDDKEKQAVIGDLDGLASSVTAGLAWNRRIFRLPATDDDVAVGWLISVGAEFGYKKFDFLDVASGMDQSQSETARRFSVSLGSLRGTGAMWSARLRHEISYKASPANQICAPLAANPALSSCRSIAVAPPARREANILQLQYTNVTWFGSTMAIRPTISRDFTNNITGVDVPFYLVRSKDSGLPSGGLKLSWQSDEDDLVLGIFISQPLSLGQ